MGEKNIQLGTGTFYINGTEFIGTGVADYTYEDYEDETVNYLMSKGSFKIDSQGELAGTFKVNRITLWKVMGLWDWVIKSCPNRRVVHLMQFGKTRRVKLKNFNRAIHILGSIMEEVK